MNPALIILIFVAGTLLWFICAFLFKPIGSLFKRLFDDAKRAINDNEENKKGE